MALSILSCGIFQFELENILPEIKEALGGRELPVAFLSPALDVKADLLEKSVTEHIEAHPQDTTILLYGGMCHTEWARITEKSGAVYPKAANCVEILLSPEKKKLSDTSGNTYYLTMGGLKLWKEIYQQGHGWDSTDARINFGSFEKVVVLDTGIFPISEEALFEFFEYTQVPVEIMQISLDYFKSLILELCKTARA
ncbi:MAG: DUF1638 domain-containing protein [Treponema sp.]|nr:DUF1638 domain-containing protein [Treponema sp.]